MSCHQGARSDNFFFFPLKRSRAIFVWLTRLQPYWTASRTLSSYYACYWICLRCNAVSDSIFDASNLLQLGQTELRDSKEFLRSAPTDAARQLESGRKCGIQWVKCFFKRKTMAWCLDGCFTKSTGDIKMDLWRFPDFTLTSPQVGHIILWLALNTKE